MITEKQLLEGIAECQGQRNPNANTCYKLASFYTILDHMKKDTEAENKIEPVSYSYAQELYQSDTEFGKEIQDLSQYEIMKIMDELMSTLSIIEPRLYASVMRKIRGEG